ncbi:General transcription factor IIE subunit 1 [Blastocladiella emersonii ATCC 22665]|nr:General transcription factor IIE subunit 1 [Blastocladiella emersonii ATCC 22665]
MELTYEQKLEAVDLAAHRELVRMTARLFFTGGEVVVLDYLNGLKFPTFPAASAAKLKMILGLTSEKDSAKVCARLTRQRLLRREQVRKESNRPDGIPPPSHMNANAANAKASKSDIYVLDYRRFCDVMSWMLKTLTERTETRINREVDNVVYMCPTCHKRYSSLEAISNSMMMGHMGATSFLMVCTVHPTVELVEDESVAKSKSPEIVKLNQQIKPLMDLLARCREVPLPDFTLEEYRKRLQDDPAEYRPSRDAAVNAKGDPANPSSKSAADAAAAAAALAADAMTTITVEFTEDAESARRRAQAAREKRAENRLPVWHRVSTVTGEPIVPEHDEAEDTELAREADGSDGDEDNKYYQDYLSQVSSVTSSSHLGDGGGKGKKRARDDEEEAGRRRKRASAWTTTSHDGAREIVHLSGTSSSESDSGSSDGSDGEDGDESSDDDFLEVPVAGVPMLGM